MAIEVEIGSATEWERLIAECEIDRKIGFIVSDERPGEFQVSLYVLPQDEESFAFSRKQPARMVSLDLLISALQEARDRLAEM